MSDGGHPSIEAGQLLMIGMGGGECYEWHRTRVAALENGLVWVEAPTRDGAPILPDPGVPVMIHTWRPVVARFTAQATVVAVRLGGERPLPASPGGASDPHLPALLGLQVADDTRIQHREHLRVHVSLQAQASTDHPAGRGARFTLDVHDLSAGGLRARCPIPLPPGSDLTMALELPELPEPLEARGQIVRVVEPPEPPGTSCVVGVAFNELRPGVREQIVRFVLAVQRERRRGGLA